MDLKEKTTILITAAGRVKSACNYNLALEEPSLLNIGSSLAIEYIKKSYKCKKIIAVNKIKNNLYSMKPFKEIEIIEVGQTKNVIETLQKVLIHINTEWILINPITTIPKYLKLEDAFIEFGDKKMPRENWSSIIIKNGKTKFYGKSEKTSIGLISYPFTGRIFAKKKDILDSIELISDEEKNDLINLAEKLFLINVKVKYTKWIDIGHSATYPQARIAAINSRFFNTLTYNENKDSIVKKSNDKLKLENEFYYYKHIPEKLKRYYPYALNPKITSKNFSYEMNYIGKPNLSEIYLFSKIGPNCIKRITDSLERIFFEFYGGKPLTIDNVKWLYSEKTNLRQTSLEKILRDNKHYHLKKIYYNDYFVNQICFPSLKKSFAKVTKKLLKFEEKVPLFIGHGDLCFNNILVDPIYGQINLIDPKSVKNESLNIFGLMDRNYDLSKLNHSLNGFYDSFVNNLFQINCLGDNKFFLDVHIPSEHKVFNHFFDEMIFQNRISKNIMDLLTGNLFLTMLPLHLEDVERMLALAIVGNMIINDKCPYKIFKNNN